MFGTSSNIECPHCGEAVRATAVVCRWCRRPLVGERGRPDQEENGTADRPVARSPGGARDAASRRAAMSPRFEMDARFEQAFDRLARTAGPRGRHGAEAEPAAECGDQPVQNGKEREGGREPRGRPAAPREPGEAAPSRARDRTQHKSAASESKSLRSSDRMSGDSVNADPDPGRQPVEPSTANLESATSPGDPEQEQAAAARAEPAPPSPKSEPEPATGPERGNPELAVGDLTRSAERVGDDTAARPEPMEPDADPPARRFDDRKTVSARARRAKAQAYDNVYVPPEPLPVDDDARPPVFEAGDAGSTAAVAEPSGPSSEGIAPVGREAARAAPASPSEHEEVGPAAGTADPAPRAATVDEAAGATVADTALSFGHDDAEAEPDLGPWPGDEGPDDAADHPAGVDDSVPDAETGPVAYEPIILGPAPRGAAEDDAAFDGERDGEHGGASPEVLPLFDWQDEPEAGLAVAEPDPQSFAADRYGGETAGAASASADPGGELSGGSATAAASSRAIRIDPGERPGLPSGAPAASDRAAGLGRPTVVMALALAAVVVGVVAVPQRWVEMIEGSSGPQQSMPVPPAAGEGQETAAASDGDGDPSVPLSPADLGFGPDAADATAEVAAAPEPTPAPQQSAQTAPETEPDPAAFGSGTDDIASAASGSDLSGVTATGELVAAVQSSLAQRGYDPGPVDGNLGPQTRSAIRSFQQRAGMAPDGNLSHILLQRLGLAGPRLHPFDG